MLQKVMAWGGSAQVGLRESGNPASRAMCNVALLVLAGKNSHAAQVRGKKPSRAIRRKCKGIYSSFGQHILYRDLPGSAQTGAGPSNAWVSALVAADSCDMFSALSWAGTRGRESGAWF